MPGKGALPYNDIPISGLEEIRRQNEKFIEHADDRPVPKAEAIKTIRKINWEKKHLLKDLNKELKRGIPEPPPPIDPEQDPPF